MECGLLKVWEEPCESYKVRESESCRAWPECRLELPLFCSPLFAPPPHSAHLICTVFRAEQSHINSCISFRQHYWIPVS